MKKSTLARFAFLLLLVAMLASLCSCTMIPDEDNRVSFEIEGYGRVVVQLDPKAAPLTVANFKKLVNEGFYNGLTFHRIADLTGEGGFIVQGGDPNGNGSGGSKETVKGEFSANGVDNPLKHTRGTISMARSNDMNSASSQFFFCTDTTEHLDGNYAAFGKVVYGMRVIDKMSEVMTVNPVTVRAEAMVAEVIKVVEKRRIDDLVVIGNDGKVAGFIDIQDLPGLKIM